MFLFRSQPKDEDEREADEVDYLVAKYKLRSGDDDDDEEEDTYAADDFVKPKKAIVDKNWFNMAIGVVIALNALTIGLETDAKSRGESGGAIWFLVELIFCTIFLSELLARIYFHRLNFFFMPGQKWWNRSDFVIVGMSLADTFVLTPMGTGGGGSVKFVTMLRFARLMRLVRLIRLFKIFKELWLVASGLIESLKTLVWICIMMFILCYVFGIFMTVTIGQNDEVYDQYYMEGPCSTLCSNGETMECMDCKAAHEGQAPFDHEVYFKTVMWSVFTLLQILTLDGWSEEIARHVVHRQGWQIVFFVAFIALGSFGLMNVIIGVVVENTLRTSEKDNNVVRKRKERDRQNVLSQLREIFEYADADGSGTLTIDEVKNALDKPEVHTNLKKIEFPVENPEHIFNLLDYDNSNELTIDEFITGCMRMKGEAKSKDLLAAQVALDTMRGYYIDLEEQMGIFNKKLRLLEATAESLIDHGEHVFLNAQEFRLRHPELKEQHPSAISDGMLDRAPWERRQAGDNQLALTEKHDEGSGAKVCLKIEIISAAALKNADVLSKSDPYCNVKMTKTNSQFSTPVLNDELNPVWNATFYMQNYIVGVPLVFEVFDKDVLKDDSLGTAVVQQAAFWPHGSDKITVPLHGKGTNGNSTLTIRITKEAALHSTDKMLQNLGSAGLLGNQRGDDTAMLMDVEPPPLADGHRSGGQTGNPARAIQDIPGAIQDIGPEAGAMVVRRS